MEKYYITTAIAYTSGKPHIGNTYEVVLADLLARFKRAQGYDVRFQTGTDEHGEKIELKAAAAGKTPKQFVDEVAGGIKNIWDLMNTSYDKFIRTTDDYHEKQIKKMFKKFYDQGDIYKGSYHAFHVAEQFTGYTGKYVSLKETIRSFKEIIAGQHDQIPESYFLYAGSIDEVVAKWKGENA